MKSSYTKLRFAEMGAIRLGSYGDYELFEVPTRSHGKWHNFILRLWTGGRQPKSIWHLGHNGTRFADNADLTILEKHDPEIARWVEQQINDTNFWRLT